MNVARGDIGPGTTDPEFIRAYLHVGEDPHPHRHTDDEDPDWWAYEELQRATWDDPRRSWDMLLDLIDVAPDEDTLMRIGIGPLADFIAENGTGFIDTIIEAARKNPPVRRTLQFASDFPHEPEEVERRIRKLIGPVEPEGD